MKRYRMVSHVLDAMQFDGTSAGVERVVAWARRVAPDWPVRPRTEYAGWTDLTGHLELEVKGMETGCIAGDWLVVTTVEDRSSVWVVDGASFSKYYEEVEA